MGLVDWIPAVSTTALFALALWLFRSLITTRLTKSVQHEFDGKLETLRADLKRKEDQITALRSGALSGLVSRQAVLDKRRLKAVDQLWAAVRSLAALKMAAGVMATFKFDAAAHAAAKNQNFRELLKAMAPLPDPQKIFKNESWSARPFVSPLAWALFAAYQAILALATLQLKILQAGLDMPEVVNPDKAVDLVKAALPHQAEYVAKYGPAAFPHLLDELETLLLIELRRVLEGAESDAASIARAASILKTAAGLMETLQGAPAGSRVDVQIASGGGDA
jgi:hypothetical protein